MIDGLSNSGSLPVLERLIQFTGQRHRIIANNIANADTPGYRPADVSPAAFQEQLAEAIDQRRENPTAGRGLSLRSTQQIEIEPDGLTLKPQPSGQGILFHDGNDRDLERTMQDLVENFAAFRFAAQMLRSQFDQINTAITGRI